MILLDDNFASTVRGIEEGRLIFVNLKKSIKYTITHSTPEVIPQLIYILAPIPLPLSAILILVIDLGFELLISLSFAWEPPESQTGILKTPPRKPVNYQTAEIYRRRLLRQARARIDEETGAPIAPEDLTRFQKISHSIRHFFSKDFWANLFENTGGEVLVDGPLLTWAYLEAGVVSSVAACSRSHCWSN
jgi:sodium/potassium-transporting ATPase subunit alpha